MKTLYNVPCLLVDDDTEFRKSTVELLKLMGLQVFEAENGKSALAILERESYIKVVIVDVKMPTMTGLEFISCAKALGLDITVVFISGHADVETVIEALRLGAFEFLQKPFRSDDLLNAVKSAVLQRPQTATDSPLEGIGLNDTQIKIAELVAKGLSNQKIAEEVQLAEPTVKYHIGKILRLFSVENRYDLSKRIGELTSQRGPRRVS